MNFFYKLRYDLVHYSVLPSYRSPYHSFIISLSHLLFLHQKEVISFYDKPSRQASKQGKVK
jgi:hypothetical protein